MEVSEDLDKMDQANGNSNGKQTCRTAAEVLDKQWIDEGMSADELDRNRRLADIFDRLLAAGRTVDDINAEWETKSSQDILTEYESLLIPTGNGRGRRRKSANTSAKIPL